MLCARGPSYVSSSTSSCCSSLRVTTPGPALWRRAVVKAAATLSCSCRHHERWRRSMRQRALDVPPAAPTRAAIINEATRQGLMWKENALVRAVTLGVKRLVVSNGNVSVDETAQACTELVWQNTWESDSQRPRQPRVLDDEELFVIEG